MTDTDPYKEREVAVQEQELALKREQFELDRRKGPLTNAAVVVTIVAGLATAVYGALNYGISLAQQQTAKSQAQKAQIDKDASTQAAQIAAQQAHDAAGLQLFIQFEDKLIPCDPSLNAAQSAGLVGAQIAMFAGLYPNLAGKFQEAANAKLTTCSAAAANVAAEKAKTQNAAPNQVADAADKARYSTLARAGPLTVGAAPRLPTVYIQYVNDAQRGSALTLQKALLGKGYAVPGVQHVLAAPNVAQVRYYHDDQQPAAQAVSNAAAAALHVSPPALRPLGDTYKSLPSGIVEFWFGR